MIRPRLLGTAIVLVYVVGLFGFIYTPLAAAQSSGTSLTTSPVSLDLAIKPGETTTNTLEVMNNSPQPVTIVMQLKMFGANGTSGQPLITDIPANSPMASWTHFSPTTFVAQPNVWTPVKLTISLPASAQLGYYFAAVFKPMVPAEPASARSTIIQGSNAVLVLIDTRAGNENRKVDIANFSVNKHLFEYLPASFTVSVHNGGNIFLAPQGNVFISRNSSMIPTIASLPINTAGGNVLPNSKRSFTSTWSDGFPVFTPKLVDGQVTVNTKGTTIEQLRWNFANADKFRFGKYYAQLTLAYNDGTHEIPVTSQVSFWVIPWKLLLLTLFIIVILGVGAWTIGRSSVRNIRKVHIKR